MHAHIPETLDGDRGPGNIQAQVPQRLQRDVGDPPARRIFPPQAAADGQRLPRDDTRDGIAHFLAVGIHHPGHHLRVGPDVGSGDVFLRADQVKDFSGITAGESLQLRAGQFFRRHADSSLGPAVGKPRQRALPCHPHGQRGHFSQIHIRMEAHASLGRPQRHIVLHTITHEHLDALVVHPDGNRHDQGTLRQREPLAEIPIQAEPLGRLLELGGGQTKRRGFQLLVEARHGDRAQTCWGAGSSGGRLAASRS